MVYELKIMVTIKSDDPLDARAILATAMLAIERRIQLWKKKAR